MNPLLDDISMKGAHGVLINITGGMDMTLFEVDEVANRIREEVDADANIIFGSTFDEKLDGLMRVSVVATGIATENSGAKPKPQMTLVASQKDPVASKLETEKIDGETIPAVEEDITLKNDLENALETETLQRTGTYNEAFEFENTNKKGNPDLGNMSKSHLQTNESLKVTESKVASSMDAMEMFNPVGEKSPKIGVKPSSDPFLPDAPEIVNIKKEQASQDPDPFNVVAL